MPRNLISFTNAATTKIYTLSLHDALPIWRSAAREIPRRAASHQRRRTVVRLRRRVHSDAGCGRRSEEHTSELQSHSDLVCRLLLEKKKSTGLLPLGPNP